MNELELIKEYQFLDSLIGEYGNKTELLEMQREISEKLIKHNKELLSRFRDRGLAHVRFIESISEYTFDSPFGKFAYYNITNTIRKETQTQFSIPYEIARLIRKYKRDNPIDFDSWLKYEIRHYKTRKFENVKSRILKYLNLKATSIYDCVKDLDYSYETIETLADYKNMFNDIEEIVGKHYSELLKLRYVKNLTIDEIGEMFGVKKSAISAKINATLKKLKENKVFVARYGNLWYY